MTQNGSAVSAPPAAQPVAPVGMPQAGQPVAAPVIGSNGTPSATTGQPGAAPVGNGRGQAAPLGMMLPMLLVFGVMMAFMLWQGKKEKKRRQEIVESLKVGSRVVTSGGVMGTVSEVGDDSVVVRVEEGKVRFHKSAVQSVSAEGR
jgi:preprotein translocase subunit YajC